MHRAQQVTDGNLMMVNNFAILFPPLTSDPDCNEVPDNKREKASSSDSFN